MGRFLPYSLLATRYSPFATCRPSRTAGGRLDVELRQRVDRIDLEQLRQIDPCLRPQGDLQRRAVLCEEACERIDQSLQLGTLPRLRASTTLHVLDHLGARVARADPLLARERRDREIDRAGVVHRELD